MAASIHGEAYHPMLGNVASATPPMGRIVAVNRAMSPAASKQHLVGA